MVGKAGRVRSDEEYIAWAANISRDIEDFRMSLDEDDWKDHVLSKYQFSLDPDKAEAQLDAVYTRGIQTMKQNFVEVGVTWRVRTDVPTHYIQYIDMDTGRFMGYDEAISRVTGLYF